MNTYLQNTQTKQYARLVGFAPITVKKMINTGEIVGHEIVKSNENLRKQALTGVNVKSLRFIRGGVLGYL